MPPRSEPAGARAEPLGPWDWLFADRRGAVRGRLIVGLLAFVAARHDPISLPPSSRFRSLGSPISSRCVLGQIARLLGRAVVESSRRLGLGAAPMAAYFCGSVVPHPFGAGCSPRFGHRRGRDPRDPAGAQGPVRRSRGAARRIGSPSFPRLHAGSRTPRGRRGGPARRHRLSAEWCLPVSSSRGRPSRTRGALRPWRARVAEADRTKLGSPRVGRCFPSATESSAFHLSPRSTGKGAGPAPRRIETGPVL